ncbi:O-antigen ligase family protein [Pyramidobacter sp. CG50-2]|nr:O-antigen ligase family protein [Pyramidobacter sp. CG50-2]
MDCAPNVANCDVTVQKEGKKMDRLYRRQVADAQEKRDGSKKFFLYCYTLSIALSPLGPVFHYILWGATLISLVYCCAVNKEDIIHRVELSHRSRVVLALFSLFLLWVVISGLFSYRELKSYGRNVTVPLEMLLGILMSVIFLGTESARKTFIKVFVAASVLILLGNLLRIAGLLEYFPNRALNNGNTLGALGLLLFPPVACFAFWSVNGGKLKQIILLFPVLSVIFFSFSSGAWLSAFLGGLVFLYYAFRFHKISCRTLMTYVACFLAAAVLLYGVSGDFRRCLLGECKQISSLHDMNELTTQRNEIWKVALHAIKKRPFLGYGGDSFYNVHEAIVRAKAQELGLTVKRSMDHPHSTYFYLCCIGGIPALLLWLAPIGLCMKKMLKYARAEKNVFFPWGVTAVMLLVEILTYGTNGDIFQGRRDIAVMVWCFIGIMVVLPDPEDTRDARRFNGDGEK